MSPLRKINRPLNSFFNGATVAPSRWNHLSSGFVPPNLGYKEIGSTAITLAIRSSLGKKYGSRDYLWWTCITNRALRISPQIGQIALWKGQLRGPKIAQNPWKRKLKRFSQKYYNNSSTFPYRVFVHVHRLRISKTNKASRKELCGDIYRKTWQSICIYKVVSNSTAQLLSSKQLPLFPVPSNYLVLPQRSVSLASLPIPRSCFFPPQWPKT